MIEKKRTRRKGKKIENEKTGYAADLRRLEECWASSYVNIARITARNKYAAKAGQALQDGQYRGNSN